MIYGDVQKNEKEVIRVQDGEYKGIKYVDVRVHYKDGNGELQPTKKRCGFITQIYSCINASISKCH